MLNKILSGGSWAKVFSHDVSGGLFQNDEDALLKNTRDEDSKLFSLLGRLENYRLKDGTFHFLLCFPGLVKYEFPCNEWIQSSNPATESNITGFNSIQLTFPKNGVNGEFQGIGLGSESTELIDDTPDHPNWFVCIGCTAYYGGQSFPGPHPLPVKKLELYAEITGGCTLGWPGYISILEF